MTDEANQAPVSPTTGETPKPSVTMGAPAPKPAATPWTPGYVHLAVVSIVALALDLGTKQWAKARLDLTSGGTPIDIIHDHLRFAFAKNPGGAFGLLQDEPETIRRPFFLGISVLAVAFIVSLYRKLTPQQWALKWGLPLVLGGALGNLIDRIQARHVIDFIDFRADWVRWLYGLFSRYPTDHWPTFNIADIAIVAGVALMAIDMFTPRRATLGGASVPSDASDATSSSALPAGGLPPSASSAAAPAATPEPPVTGGDARLATPGAAPGVEPEPAPKET